MPTLDSLRIEIIKLLKETLIGKKVDRGDGKEVAIKDYRLLPGLFRLSLSDNTVLELNLRSRVIFDFEKDKIIFQTSEGKTCVISE